ncbi:NAD(P)/FAD-dependent oxidoreductase [Tenacibaculum sp. TC6]|uniref:NAD(P)/FAD-dependent oxidoreductase n=1 Tax=Tenacibaculum sp. TC6 TaxID=3423223 RepID=UPI003D35D685
MKKEYDVIVVGAGPAGGQCARNLAKEGLSVLLVEKYNSFYDNDFSSAGMSLEGFNEFNFPESIVGRYWKNFTIQTSNEFAQWKGDTHKGVVLDFAKLRTFLADDCKDNGGDVLMGYSYTSKEYTNDGVIAHFYSKKEDKKLALKAKLLVDATGPARKVIYETLKEQPEMETSAGVEYLIEVDAAVYDKFKDDLFFFLGDKWSYKGYSWIFPMKENILKVGSAKLLYKTHEKSAESLKQITERIITDYMEAPNYKIIDVHGGAVRTTRNFSEAFYKERIVAIGDSVSTINPLGGEGIRYALRCANAVTPHVINFVRKDKNTFSTYRRKWRKKYLFTWKLCLFLSDTVYYDFSDAILDEKIRKYKKLVEVDQLVDIVFEFKFTNLFGRVLSYLWKKIKTKFSFTTT